jgi:hypothetical protein
MKALLGVLTVTTSLAVSKGNERIVASDSIPGDAVITELLTGGDCK